MTELESQTLKNYISSADNNDQGQSSSNQSNSQCVDCKHIGNIQKGQNNLNQQSSDSDSSSHENSNLVGPLHKHIVEHSRQIQQTIVTLQKEIQKLKRANQSKDKVIQNLKSKLKIIEINNYDRQNNHFRKNNHQEQNRLKQTNQMVKQTYQMKKYRQNNQSQSQAKYQQHNQQYHQRDQQYHQSDQQYHQQTQQQQNDIQIVFQDRFSNKDNYQNKRNPYSINNMEQNYLPAEQIVNFKNKTYRYTNKMNKKNLNMQKQSDSQFQYKPNHFNKKESQQTNRFYSQKDNQTKLLLQNSKLNNLLIQYKQKLNRIQNYSRKIQTDMKWMINFVHQFIKMGNKLSICFNQNISNKKWNLKKKTKVTWRYLKSILNHFVIQQ